MILILLLFVLIVGIFIGFVIVGEKEEKQKAATAPALLAKQENKKENKGKIL